MILQTIKIVSIMQLKTLENQLIESTNTILRKQKKFRTKR